MADLEKIADELSGLTVLEAAELSKLLEEKWGVSAAAPVAVAAMPGAGDGAAVAEEQTEFDVVLTGIGDKKINVIKEVREAAQSISSDAIEFTDVRVEASNVVLYTKDVGVFAENSDVVRIL